MRTLAHTRVPASGPAPARWMLFLHGILGSRANWRGFARGLVQRRPGWGAVLVDLRLHGDSQGFAPPHTVDACAADLVALVRELDLRVAGISGHSFGGKVALAFAAGHPTIEEIWLIDSMPGARQIDSRPGSPLRIVDLLEELPRECERREQFVDALVDRGVDASVAQWLAMNLVPVGDRYRMRLDLAAIRSLLDDYAARDDWAAVERPPARAVVHLVVAGRSSVWSAQDVARARNLAQSGPVRVHAMPDAGHWVHVEDPAGLLEVMAPVAVE